MSELVDFLTARLDEDEQVAKAACEYHDAAWRVDPEDAGTLLLWDPMPDSPGFGHTMNERVTAHIARHDPARVLAEVAVKRRIIERHERQSQGRACQICWPFECELAFLALPDADHPDYRPEWRVRDN